MKERLMKLRIELADLLKDAPEDYECTDAENEMYADIANLKNSIEYRMKEM